MCGRAYQTYSEEELCLRYLNEKAKHDPMNGFIPNYNLSPTQKSPVVFREKGELRIGFFRWGLVPFWAKDVKAADKYSLINAKAEDIDEKRSFKEPFLRRRCIVPFSGFFEWQRTDGGPKRPYAISLKGDAIMSLAGVWECWKSKTTNEEVFSFSIITTSANSLVAKIHNRMPAILSRLEEKEWLDPHNHDILALKNLLKPCSSDWLEAREISNLVNNPRNNRPELLLAPSKAP
jgi:putative SOS response-associated peptidase YedK